MALYFWKATLKVRRQWRNIFKILRRNYFLSGTQCPGHLQIKHEKRIRLFSGKPNLTHPLSDRPLEDVLHQNKRISHRQEVIARSKQETGRRISRVVVAGSPEWQLRSWPREKFKWNRKIKVYKRTAERERGGGRKGKKSRGDGGKPTFPDVFEHVEMLQISVRGLSVARGN